MHLRWSITKPYLILVSVPGGALPPETRVVRRQVRQRPVVETLHERLELAEILVTRATPVRLEELHLVEQVARRLAREVGHALGLIAAPVVAVTRRAGRGGLTPVDDARAIELDRRRLAGLGGEVRRHLVGAEILDHLGERLHLRRRAAAG